MSKKATTSSGCTTEQTSQRHRRESSPAEPYPTSSVPAATISSSFLSLMILGQPQDLRSNTRQPTLVSITLLFDLLIGTQCRHPRKMNDLHMDCLRKWHDTVAHTVVLAGDGTTSIHAMRCSAPLSWAGHVVCMSDERLPKKIYEERNTGKHSSSGQKNDTRTP